MNTKEMITFMSKVEELADRLTMEGLSLSIVESCTGGAICKAISDMPGCSTFFEGGVVAYSDSAKIEIIGVTPECLKNHGTVSRRTALAMANGACETFTSDIGLSITGIAGPSGGSEEKPVGLVFIAVSNADREMVEEFRFDGDRDSIREKAVKAAIDLCIRFLDEK